LRTSLDLLLDRTLADAVADLDAVLRAGFVDIAAIQRMVAARSDRGIVAARQAVELADPRAESRPEARLRVYLVLDDLHPVPQYLVSDWQGRSGGPRTLRNPTAVVAAVRADLAARSR
jgi:hypothetical protein